MTLARRSILTLIIVFSIPLLGLDECGNRNTETDEEIGEQVQQNQAELFARKGLPEITNYQEYEWAKMIMEKRDEAVTTYTYFVDRNGNKHFVCESLGYGLPYSTQLTNPEKTVHEDHGGDHPIPQPEPNGLFMPENVSATWILCTDGEGGVRPVYSEPKLLVSPFRFEDVE